MRGASDLRATERGGGGEGGGSWSKSLQRMQCDHTKIGRHPTCPCSPPACPCIPVCHGYIPVWPVSNMNRQFKYTAGLSLVSLVTFQPACMSTDVTSQRRRDEPGWPPKAAMCVASIELISIYISSYIFIYTNISTLNTHSKNLDS
jgi:hypothetical protein